MYPKKTFKADTGDLSAKIWGISLILRRGGDNKTKRKDDMEFFRDDNNRIKYNRICLRCIRECKQSFRSALLECKN